jgi:hypothetical protein
LPNWRVTGCVPQGVGCWHHLYARARPLSMCRRRKREAQHSLDLVNPPLLSLTRARSRTYWTRRGLSTSHCASAARATKRSSPTATPWSRMYLTVVIPSENHSTAEAAAGSMNRFIDHGANFTGKRVKGSEVRRSQRSINPFNLIATSGVLGLKGPCHDRVASPGQTTRCDRRYLTRLNRSSRCCQFSKRMIQLWLQSQCALVRNGEAPSMINVTLDSVDGFWPHSRDQRRVACARINALEQPSQFRRRVSTRRTVRPCRARQNP